MDKQLQMTVPKENECDRTGPMGDGLVELRRLWEVESYFICPIVGICVPLDEQQRLLKRVEICIRNKTAFEIHELLVAACESENRLSEKLEHLLCRKFREENASLFEMDEDAFMTHFRQGYRAGEYRAALWAAAVRQDLKRESRREIFGMVHMAMHWNGEQRAGCLARISQVEKREETLRQRLKTVAVEKKTLYRQTQQLLTETRQLQTRLTAALEANKGPAGQPAHSTVAGLQKEILDLRARQEASLETIERQHRRIAALTDANLKQSEDFDQLRAFSTALQQSVRETVCEMQQLPPCDESCPAFDLCRKRVLVVGGIARMESLVRRLIEDGGGVLDYHDGNLKGGVRQLAGSMKRADIVLCAVGCNSHAACALVKNLGKKHKKPVHMMSNFSLNTISQVIRGHTAEAAVGARVVSPRI